MAPGHSPQCQVASSSAHDSRCMASISCVTSRSHLSFLVTSRFSCSGENMVNGIAERIRCDERDTPSRHSTDARYPSIDGTRCCRFSTSLEVAHSVGVTEAMISIDDGRWGWDGMGSGPFLSTVRCTSCGRSLEGHLTLAWKANGVHPHPSISPRWVHPSLPSTIPWQTGSPRDSFLISFTTVLINPSTTNAAQGRWAR